MQVVADTNIIVASLLRKGDTRKILFSKKLEIFSPDRLKFEIFAHKEEFKQKTSMIEQEFIEAVELEFENLTVIFQLRNIFHLNKKLWNFALKGMKMIGRLLHWR